MLHCLTRHRIRWRSRWFTSRNSSSSNNSNSSASLSSSRFAGFLVHALEISCLAGAAGPFPVSDLRIRTEGTSERHSPGGAVLNITCRNDPGGRDAFLDPSLQRRYKVMIGVGRLTRDAAIPETICADTASTVAHSRHHKQPIEI